MPDSSDLSHETLREYLDAEKASPNPSSEMQQRVFSRLSTTLGFIGGADAAEASVVPNRPPPVHPHATGKSLAHLLTHGPHRGLATFLVGAAVGATTYGTVARLRQESKPIGAPTEMVAHLPARTVPVEPMSAPVPSAVDEPAPKPLTSAPSNGRSSVELAAGRSKDDGLAAERKLVEMARTALARGQVDGALASLHRHARQYPNGRLAEERDGLLVQAMVAKGDYAQARARAARFARQYPHSLFSPAIEQALQSIP